MRCTPVGTWETRRPKYVPGRGISKAPRRVLSARDDPAEEKAHEESRHHHSYASSYDVSFIFEALHRKRFVDEQGHSIRGRTLTSDEIRIPQTVVYRGGFPAQWYFHSKQDGRIIKKKPQNIVIPQIFEVFGAENGSCNTDVVAIFVGTVGSAEGPRNQVVHFDRKKLKDFLYSENVMKEGFLQRFVAPEAVPFDSAARNATLHAIWSRYDLKVEQRANKMKLDDRRHNFVEKVNIMTTRTNSMTINCNSMLHRKIDEQCKLIAEHIQATSSDKAEVTSITAYFKIGENNRLWLLFASSVTVAPKFQDGFGYIPSLKTFTGRHSPMLTCPDNLMGDEDQHRPQNPKANCSMCDLSSSEDENSCAYAITYKMLSEYVQKKREFFLMQIKGSAVLELDHTHQSTANRRNELEESDLNTKAASVFTVLDTDKDGCIAIVELWSGLMDLGYFPNEISTILGLAAKMRKLHADNPAHYIHATNASDLGDALGSPFGLRQIRKAQVLSPEDVMAREAGKARQTVPAASSGANVGSSAAEQSLGSEKSTGSPLSGDADRREAAGRRDEERPENDSMPRVVEFKDDCRGSRCDIEVLEVKEMFPAVTKVEFARGMGQAVMQMSPERRSRWCANVDMRGEVFHALPKEICGVDGQDPDGQNEGYTQAEVEKKVAEFARKAANRAKMFILQKRLPPFLQHLKTQIPSAHMRRIGHLSDVT